MVKSGLVSVTFRKLSPKEIVKLVSLAGLEGIEWGGDIHVPHGDLEKARKVRKITEDAGLETAAYGSYYRVGSSEGESISFESVLETALELKAPVIRVWAGNRGSKDSNQEMWDLIVEDSIRIADMAQKEGITVAYEYHANTLTDTWQSAVKLLREVERKNMLSYWQPPTNLKYDECLEGLNEIKPWLSNIHAYHWESGNRMELKAGINKWLKYMEVIKEVVGTRYCMIEFVKDDTPEQFLNDAEVLKEILA